MSVYTLLDSTVSFSESEDRFWNLQFRLWSRMAAADQAFELWYRRKSTAGEVLKNCERLTMQLIEQHWVTPFTGLLASYKLGNIDTAEFQRQCVDLTVLRATLAAATEVLDKIDKSYHEDKVLKQLETALATPPGVNAVVGTLRDPAAVLTGLDAPDCVLDYAAPAPDLEPESKPLGSSYARQKNLYRHLEGFLRLALLSELRESSNRMVQIINRQVPGFLTASFSYARSEAALLRAGMGTDPEADRAAALEAFRCCPWNRNFYDFAFERFSTHRPKLFTVAQAFHIDMGQQVEQILQSMFAERSGDSVPELQALRAELGKVMHAYGVSSSATLDEVDFLILEQTTVGLEEADNKTCQNLLRSIKKLDVQEKCRMPYEKKIRERMKHMVETSIGETADQYLLRCNILDPSAVQRGLTFMEKECPPESKEQYLAAFRTFNAENIAKGRRYQPMSGHDLPSYVARYIGFLIMVAGLAFLLTGGWLKLLTLIPLAVGLALQLNIFSWQRLWKTMTLEGTVVHKAFLVDKDELRRMKAEAGRRSRPAHSGSAAPAAAPKAAPPSRSGSGDAGKMHTFKGFYD